MNSIDFVVGIGASAGGLEAINKIFDSLPEKDNISFVIIQHLSPDFKSVMQSLLEKHTKMAVRVAQNEEVLEPGVIYLNSPLVNLKIENGKFIVSKIQDKKKFNLPIDLFLTSLALAYKEKSIGIILSGTGSDGSRGIGTIKEEGGTVIAQAPQSALFDSMPNAAIAKSCCDFILAPEDIAKYIHKISRQNESDNADLDSPKSNIYFLEILTELEKDTGVNFHNYKKNALIRRVNRRINALNLDSFSSYLQEIRENAHERNELFNGFLIGVTQFFRDVEAFDILQNEVIPLLIGTESFDGHTLRIWVPGCSTGEEAVSIAILLDDYIQKNELEVNYKIYATDVDLKALKTASNALYSLNSVVDLPKEYLEKYFNANNNQIELKAFIRERIVYTIHNILKDPPFVRTDLISCRNLLIYIEGVVQTRVLQNFTFSLADKGILILGPSEHINSQAENYQVISSKWNVFQKKDALNVFPARISAIKHNPRIPGLNERKKTVHSSTSILNTEIKGGRTESTFNWYLCSKHAPSSIFIDEDFNVLFIHGDAGKRLVHNQGMFEKSILNMVKPSLSRLLRKAVNSINEEQKSAILKNIIIDDHNPDPEGFNITISKPIGVANLSNTFQLVFETVALTGSEEMPQVIGTSISEEAKNQIQELEAELKHTKIQLRNVVEELELSNEELQSSNEELMASNEELQATNEELQSLNEELYIVNSEYQDKLEQLKQLNDDIGNLLDNLDIGTIYLDNDLNIRKFTGPLESIVHLQVGDIGRNLANFTNNLERSFIEILETSSSLVLNKLTTVQREVQSKNGRFFLKRISPFITGEKKINGVVITFVDITEIKEKNTRIETLQTNYEILFSNLNEGFAHAKMIYNDDGKPIDWEYITVNPAFEKQTGLKVNEVLGKRITEIIPGIESDPANWIERYGYTATTGEEQTIEDFSEGLQRYYIVHIFSPAKGEFAATFSDISNLKIAEQKLLKTTIELNEAQHVAKLGSWYLDLETNKVTWSEELFKIYGFDPSLPPPPFDTHEKLFTPESWKLVSSSLDEILANGTPYDIELEFIKHHGKLGWLRAIGKPIKNNEGKIIALRGVAYDISESKNLSVALNYEREFIKKINDIAPCGIYIYDFSLGHNIFINSQYTRILGYTFDEIRELSEKEFQKLFHPDDADRIVKHMEQITNGENDLGIEYRFKHKNGDWVWCYSVDSAFDIDKKGGVKQFIGAFIDITNQKNAELELNKTQQFYNNMLQFAPDGIALLDKNEKIEFIEGKGKGIFNIDKTKKEYTLKDIVSPKDYEEVSENFNRFYDGRRKHLQRQEFRANSKNNNQLWIEGTFSKGKDFNNADSVILNFKDISYRKKTDRELRLAIEKLKMSNRDLEQFAYIASHDLQEPLNSMNSLIDLIKNQYEKKLDPVGQKSLNYVKTAGERMSQLIKGLLEHSRIGRTMVQEQIDTNKLLSDIIDDLQNVISETQATINVGKLPTIPGYQTELRLMFQNLLSNAIKFKRPSIPPEISIRAFRKNGWNFVIEDNGIGIKKDYLDRIFEIFQRLHGKDEYEGTGIGLAHVKKIIDLHSGSIKVESDGISGTRFIINLPT